MDAEFVNKVLNRRIFQNILAVQLSGGEPLLNKSIIDIIRVIKKRRRLQCTMFTNGTLLAEYLPKLIDAGLDEINLSLYDNTLEKLCTDLPNLCSKFPYINASYVLLRSTIEKNPNQIFKVIDMFQMTGCRSLRFNLCRASKDADGKDDTTEIIDDQCSAYRDFVAESLKRYKRLKIFYPKAAYSVIKGPRNKKCRSPWESLMVLPSGKLTMCCHYRQFMDPIGDIFNDEDTKSYNAPIWAEIRGKLLANDPGVHEYCAKCACLTGGCNV